MSDHATRYKLAEAKFNERVAAFRESPDTASLADEISLARGLIESRLNEAKTPQEWAAASILVRDMLGVLSTLCRAQHAREKDMQNLLDKRSILALGSQIVEILVEELQGIDPEQVERIADRIGDAITNKTLEPEV